MRDATRNRVLWAMTVLFGVFAFLKATPLAPSLMAFIPATSILVPTLFAFMHGSRRLGWPTMLTFFGIAFAVSWCLESLSIATGFPFGHYHYTDKLGPRLGTVPLLIMPAYFAMCYVSWNLAHIVLDKFDHRADTLQRFAVPVIAAFIMVMWDLSMDAGVDLARRRQLFRRALRELHGLVSHGLPDLSDPGARAPEAEAAA